MLLICKIALVLALAKINLKVKTVFKIFLNHTKTFNCQTEYMPNVKFRPIKKSNPRKILST